jgi:ATP-dependent protease ClpP protease subunit
MNPDDLKYVVGKAEAEAPAIIRFFGSVTEETTNRFNDEFLWLQDCVKPSKIVVLINSDGGSVVHGMSTFSIIQSCPIEVDCVIEGIAASMGSVIWAAGDNLFMHDYSILMIHNPFVWGEQVDDENIQAMIKAFRKQLETIYRKRFGLSKDKVSEIMDGDGECDGTYFNAKDAVKAGILPASNIIKTPKQIFDKVQNEIEGITNASSLRDIMSSVISQADENKLLESVFAIHRKNELQIQQNQMEKNENVSFGAVAAQLGFPADTPLTSVANRVSELLKAESNLKDIQDKFDALTIQHTAKEAEVKNLQDELKEVKASLQTYQDAEKAAFEAQIGRTIQDAIDSGKIEASAKDNWIEMAHKNFDMVKSVLASIQGREKITDEIANDPENVKRVQDELKTAEERMAAEVEKVLGKKVELAKF